MSLNRLSASFALTPPQPSLQTLPTFTNVYYPYVGLILSGFSLFTQATESKGTPEQFTEALAYFSQAIEEEPKASLAWLVRAQIFEQQKLYDAAIQDYKAYLHLMPTDAQALKACISLYTLTGQSELVNKELASTLKLAREQKTLKDNLLLQHKKILTDKTFFKSQTSITCFNGSQSEAAKTIISRIEQAAQYYFDAQFAEEKQQIYQAEYFYRRCLETYEHYFFAGLGLARIGKKVKPQAALDDLQKMLAVSDHAEIYWQMGNCLVKLNQTSQASAAYECALELSLLQQVSLPRYKIDKVITLLQPEFKREEKKEETRKIDMKKIENQSLRFFNSGQYIKALQATHQAITLINPLNPTYYHTNGYIYTQQRDFKKAKINFALALLLYEDKQQIDIYEEVAEIYLHQGDIENAERLYLQADEFQKLPLSHEKKKQAFFKFIYGVAKEALVEENYELTIQLLLKALDLLPQSAILYLDLGITYRRLGDKGNAKKYYQLAEELDPNNPQIKKANKRFLMSLDPLTFNLLPIKAHRPKKHTTYPIRQFSKTKHKKSQHKGTGDRKTLENIHEDSPSSADATLTNKSKGMTPDTENDSSSSSTPQILSTAKEPIKTSDLAKFIMTFIAGLGYKIALYGGALRDQLLGIENEIVDLDFLIEAPSSCLSLLTQKLDAHLEPRTQIPNSYKLIVDDAIKIDILLVSETPFSKESVKKADFTINSLRMNHQEEMIDILGTAIADLQEKVIRTPIPAKEAVLRDPLIIIRAVKLLAQLPNFHLDPPLEAAIRQYHTMLLTIDPGRLNIAIKRLFSKNRALRAYEKLLELNLFSTLFYFTASATPIQKKWLHNEMAISACLISPSLSVIYANILVSSNIYLLQKSQRLELHAFIRERALLANVFSYCSNVDILIDNAQRRLTAAITQEQAAEVVEETLPNKFMGSSANI